jgi:hypothetical protein
MVWFAVVVGAVLALALVGVLAIRSLRTFVRSLWPH